MANLLLVDDDPDLAVIVAMLGKRAGHTVSCCQDVASAWAMLCQAPPDLVLLDVNLPGASGLELCRLRAAEPAREGLAGVRIALFVQPALTDDVAAGLGAGADFLISKELVSRPDQWQRRVAEVLSWSSGARHGQGAEHSVECGGRGLDACALGVVPEDWALRINRALAEPGVRQLGPEALRVLLCRALAQAGCAGEEMAWLQDGARLATGPAANVSPERVAGVLVALAEQMERFVGAEVSAPFRTILRAPADG